MKKTIAITLFLVTLLSVGLKADDEIDDFTCDNAPYVYLIAKKNYNAEREYLFGLPDNRGIYKEEAVDYCRKDIRPCDRGTGEFRDVFFEDNWWETVAINYPTFALLLNNKEVFEYLTTVGGYGELIDNGLYKVEKEWNNSEFMTQAHLAIRFGQVGILKYLIKKYDVNLLKKWGYIYILGKDTPKENKDSLDMANMYIEHWKKINNYQLVQCTKQAKKVVEKWYAENANKPKYKDAAEKYNKILDYWAHKYKAANDTPIFTPVNSFDMLRLKIEDNYAQNIEKQIDNLIEKIMRGFDLSGFGNKA